MNRCISTCIARRFDFSEIKRQFSGIEQVSVFRDALHLKVAGGHVFIFNYGVMVLWGLSLEAEHTLHRKVAGYCIAPHPDPIQDEFSFELDAEQNRIQSDHILLIGHEPLTLLAVSHAIAQSSKLEEFESHAQQTIEETSDIPRSMAATGSTRLPRKNIARMRGRLFLVESDINLNYSLLDTPEFFWEYPAMEDLYQMTSRYLELTSRVELLNRKLTIIHNLFDMLADEQKHKHSSLLEWIIIWLIAIEILIFLLPDILKMI
ncbi:MAG: RMD1 family protein [Chromatiales bacterium]|jgi:uncharacterized Rmd1/YagE family protein